ncbi:MAG: hypothetical protein WD045_04295 [Pirellulaceae bacterium]
MARWFRIWEKKRGPRRTISRMVGKVGEAFFFSALFFFGTVSTTMVVAAVWLQTWPISVLFPEIAYRSTLGIVQESRIVASDQAEPVRYRPEVLLLVETEQERLLRWTFRDRDIWYETEEVALREMAAYEVGLAYHCWVALELPRPVVLHRSPSYGLWGILLILPSFMVVGGIGLIYSLLLLGTSIERRSALANKANSLDFMAESLPLAAYPGIPNDSNLTNSPGVRLAYRLPIEVSPSWWLLATFLFSLLWSGMAAVFFIAALNNHLKGNPDWLLTIITLPAVAIAILSIYRFLHEATNQTRIGPTCVEISNTPLFPGREYRVFVTQAGRIRMERLSIALVCDEAATFLQGTDVRSETCRVVHQGIAERTGFWIRPGLPFEADYQLRVPEGSMHSFKSRNNAVHWKLVVRIVAEGGRTFERSFPILVYPDDVGAMA